MKGESFNALVYADPQDILSLGKQLKEMSDELRYLGYNEIADDTDEIKRFAESFREEMNSKMMNLIGVWGVVALMYNGSLTFQQAKVILDGYKKEDVGNEIDCPFDFTSRCTWGRCDCKPNVKP